MEIIAAIAESKIRRAMREGKFDRLPGRGRPLPPDEFARTPAELRMGFRVLKNSGALPPALEARNEVARLGNLIAAAGDPGERTRLSRLRHDAELRYALSMEQRR